MSVFKCKMCGGALEINEGDRVAECEYCGTKQTVPRLDDERKANLYDRANHFRRNNEFDKAAGIYEQILNEDTTDSEAYWSLVLCQYGIEYVEDPATHKRVPTVNRAQFTSIFDDENYKLAIENADVLQRSIYEEEANAINEIQKGILAISQKEEPFDVFICYKETDNNGRRTPDSVLATDLYHQLTQEGFKVFFARITLEDKLGTAYEPYIFAALNSAKVMVVLGTKPEYFNAVWVKNEWSRYLALVKQSGGKKILIPAYKDMDPYDLPEEFSHLQAQDMSKLGFMQDLIRGIKKLAQKDEPKATVKETVVVGGGNESVAPLLKRAFLFLEDGEWQEADEYCEKVLDRDPENAEAYVGKLMAELKVRRREELANCAEPFDASANYKKAARFGGEKTAAELRGYVAAIIERNETAKKQEVYDRAAREMDAAKSEADFKKAAELFSSIPGFRDADEQTVICKNKIEEINAKEQRDAEERRIARAKTAKKWKKIAAVFLVLAVLIVAVVILMNKVIIPNSKYNSAMELYNAQKYEDAFKEFNVLYYKDSDEKAAECLFMKQKAGLTNVSVGSTIKFGFYEQDNNTSNGKEEIEWKVLAVEGNKALVISQYALDCQRYNSTSADTTWEKCTLRTWLNGTFYNTAFGADHQKMIASSTVTADKKPSYRTSAGNNTTDKVFLLSHIEVRKYLSSNSARQCSATAYAEAQGAYTNTSNGNFWWWLRSPGDYFSLAAYVNYDGSVNYNGGYVNNNIGVRPAMWISLEP